MFGNFFETHDIFPNDHIACKFYIDVKGNNFENVADNHKKNYNNIRKISVLERMNPFVDSILVSAVCPKLYF